MHLISVEIQYISGKKNKQIMIFHYHLSLKEKCIGK